MALVPAASDRQTSTDSGSSSQALVATLPEQWPLPNQPRERYYNNAEFTNVTHTAVNKAQAHLELLQNAIEDWTTSRVPSQVSRFAKSAVKSQSSGTEGLASVKKSLIVDELETDALKVVGIGQGQGAFHYYDDEPGVPYLGAEEVVDEVTQLMVKLENERLQAEEDIRRERDRVVDLAARIDRLTEAKLLRIPEAVQAEHEACIEDIAELNWHVQNKRKTLDKSRRIHTKSVRLNEQLKEEMAYIKEHDPLVREKLELELSKIVEIQDVGTDTQKELQETQKKQQKAETKNQQAHTAANQERGRMRAEVHRANDNLAKAREAVRKSEEQFADLCERIVAAKEQRQANGKEIEVQRARHSANFEKQKMLKATVDELRRSLLQEEHRTRGLNDEMYETEDNHQKLKANQDAQRAEMQAAVNHSEDRYIFLRREADENLTELQDMQDKLKDCKRQKIDDEKNLERMDNELVRTKEDMVKTLEEFAKVTDEHSSISKKLESEEKKVMFVEDSLKSSIVQLQRQVQDEVNTRDTLVLRIETDTRDLSRNREEGKVKKSKLKKMSQKMDTLVQQIRQKVEKLRTEAAERLAAAEEKQQELDVLLAERREVEQRLDERIGQLRPLHQSEKAEVERLQAQLADLSKQIDMMNKKMRDIYDQSGMIRKTEMKFNDAIAMLEQQLDEQTHELGKTERTDDSLKAQLAGIEARIADKADGHRRLQEMRRETHRQLVRQYKEALEANNRLAGEYRQHQNEAFRMKEDLLDLLNEILQLEVAARDTKQGKRLQEKTQFALKVYLRCKQSLVELRMDDMQSRGRSNQKKTAILEGEIRESVSGITEFLGSQMDVLMLGQRVQQQQQQQQQQQATA